MSFQDVILTYFINWFGHPITLITGDTLVLDRWIWLKKKLLKTKGKRLLDLGCGSGAFSLGAGLLGYHVVGLTWDKRDHLVAEMRAELLKLDCVKFEIQDIRDLETRKDLAGLFDVVVCLETIEHIIDDSKLMINIANMLTLGGMLILSTPNLSLRPISKNDNGPFSDIEDGSHVRKGYKKEDLYDLCQLSGLQLLEIGYISGFFSQKITAIMRELSRIHPLLGWMVVLPLRIFPPILDNIITDFINWPYYTITLFAEKKL